MWCYSSLGVQAGERSMVFKYNKLITQIKLSESCNVGRFVLINL